MSRSRPPPVEHSAACDALVPERVTYEQFASRWAARIDVDTTGVSAYLSGVAKYVATSTPQEAVRQTATILRGPIEGEPATLKAAAGQDITIAGSASLATALVPSGLVDLVRLRVYPAVQGKGRGCSPTASRPGSLWSPRAHSPAPSSR